MDADLQHLGAEAPAVAGPALHERVGQELQLDLLVAGALADAAGAGRGVERERGRLEAALARLGRAREDLAQRLEHAHVRRRVDARGRPERRLVHQRDAAEGRGSVEAVACPGLGLAEPELPPQVPVHHLVDERRLARARDPGHAHEQPERQVQRQSPGGCSPAPRGSAGAASGRACVARQVPACCRRPAR